MSDAIIAEKYPNAETTESGLKYIVTEAGDGGDKPTKGTAVKAHYTGYLLDGS